MVKQEWRSILKNPLMIMVLVAIILIPTIYSTLFLASMWDPYGNLDKLPVAVVNEDRPYLYDGKTLTLKSTIKPDDDLADTRGVGVAKALSVNGKVLVGYRCNFKPTFAWFDRDGGLLAMGHSQYVTQRFQIYQTGGRIVLVILAQDLLEAESAGKSIQAQISVYRPE